MDGQLKLLKRAEKDQVVHEVIRADFVRRVLRLPSARRTQVALEEELGTGKLHFFLEILAFFQNFSKLFGKMPRFSPIFWKSDFSKFLIFFFSFGGRLRITFHASENYF
jgi:hypothetical protein